MRAQLLRAPRQPLEEAEIPEPLAGPGQILLRVLACGVCRTDLHIVDGELAEPTLPLVLGHQIVGEVVATGPGARRFAVGELAGVAWLGWADGTCKFCRQGRENLCPSARFTGYQLPGGYAEMTVADEAFAFRLHAPLAPVETAPLLCAGLIGYRALVLAGEAERLGVYGFGAAGHIVAQVARHRGQRVYAFTRPGDGAAQALARKLGAVWAGGSDEKPPDPLDAAIIFAPAGELVPRALAELSPGGTVVCGGIHMSDIPSFPYSLLWGERAVRSVANLTRQDGAELLQLAHAAGVRTEVHPYTLADANRALDDLRHGRFTGAAVLVP
jgi:alcohol dehydrogenase, propanol-preferring